MNVVSWLQSRKKLLKMVKEQVHLQLGHRPEDLKDYHQRYRDEFGRGWRLANEKKIQVGFESADFVLGGDFHAFGQSQRTHLREWRRLLKSPRPLVLGFECIESKKQLVLDRYLLGKMTEEEFLAQVDWQQSWGFSWEAYRPLFEFARQNKIKVYALNKLFRKRSVKTLHLRDQHAARVLEKIKKKEPLALIYCLFGDLHLAQAHLPNELRKINKLWNVMIYFQNVDELYFRFFRRLHQSDLLWTSQNRFCRLASPPWVKWQSYLMFLESQIDQDLESEWEPLDLTDRVGELVQVFCKDLKLKVSLNPLAVYSSYQENWLKEGSSLLSVAERQVLNHLIEKDRSFYLVSHRSLYLSRLSINHAATLAGWYIHAQLSHRKSNLWSQSEEFLPLIWCEAVGFFFSKLINPKRKAEHPRMLKMRLAGLSSKDEARPALLLALEQRMSEIIWLYTGRMRKPRLRFRKDIYYVEAASLLGQMLGEKLFEAFQSQRLPLSKLRLWLMTDVDGQDPTLFNDFYFSVLRRLESARPTTHKGDLRAG